MTHEQEDEVRRALASTPPEGPMPPEVAARLDATLAELVAHRPAPGPDQAQVAALEERPRRRWPAMLVAAASVSVLAYGVGVVVGGGSGGDAQMATADRDSSLGGASGAQEERGAVTGDAESAPLDEAPQSAFAPQPRQLLTDGLVALRTETIRRDVTRLIGPVADRTREETAGDARMGELYQACDLPAVGTRDELAAVRLDGTRATLVVRPTSGGTRVAEVYSCDEPGRLLVRTRVPTRR